MTDCKARVAKRLQDFIADFTFDPSVGLYGTPPDWTYYREKEVIQPPRSDVYEMIKDLYEI